MEYYFKLKYRPSAYDEFELARAIHVYATRVRERGVIRFEQFVTEKQRSASIGSCDVVTGEINATRFCSLDPHRMSGAFIRSIDMSLFPYVNFRIQVETTNPYFDGVAYDEDKGYFLPRALGSIHEGSGRYKDINIISLDLILNNDHGGEEAGEKFSVL